VRIGQILDAALVVFTEKGFAGSRIDDIALLAGLSKGGIYAHFDSKEDIFEALITRSLAPVAVDELTPPPGTPITVDLLVESVIEPCYRTIALPATAMTLRLMLADGRQVSGHVERWQRAVIGPFNAVVEQLVRRGVRQGTLRKGALTAAPWLLLAPIAQSVLWQLVYGDQAPRTLQEQLRDHVAMLREALTP
jgi:AcrR family transcriptional regulator